MDNKNTGGYLNPDDPEIAAIISEKARIPMQSEKARLHVLGYSPYERDENGLKVPTGKSWVDNTFEAIVIAEEEMNKKDRVRAIEAYCAVCGIYGICARINLSVNERGLRCDDVKGYIKAYDNH